MNDYYVYVYIDPRNFEEFYYGKGKGARKEAHLFDESVSPKTKRIAEIKSEGLLPIIRVIARGLSESEALLIEATLLWKLGKYTTNAVAGHFKDRFRPHDTLHKHLSGFDFRNGLYYFNVGECEYRFWKDCKEFGFISAGQGKRWVDAIQGFEIGDVFAAYLKGHGYVGIGKILKKALPASDVSIDGEPLLFRFPYMKGEAVAFVQWIRAVNTEDAKIRRKSGIFSSQLVRASLDGQPDTVRFLEEAFSVRFQDLLLNE